MPNPLRNASLRQLVTALSLIGVGSKREFAIRLKWPIFCVEGSRTKMHAPCEFRTVLSAMFQYELLSFPTLYPGFFNKDRTHAARAYAFHCRLAHLLLLCFRWAEFYPRDIFGSPCYQTKARCRCQRCSFRKMCLHMCSKVVNLLSNSFNWSVHLLDLIK